MPRISKFKDEDFGDSSLSDGEKRSIPYSQECIEEALENLKCLTNESIEKNS